MSQRIDAIFEHGVFRPEVPVNIADGQRVSLAIELPVESADELADVRDLLDIEFMASCRQNGHPAPSLQEVRSILSPVQISLADLISQERDER
jgi:predicted DNA-binding antitoxin AbrB/MazE fold protein